MSVCFVIPHCLLITKLLLLLRLPVQINICYFNQLTADGFFYHKWDSTDIWVALCKAIEQSALGALFLNNKIYECLCVCIWALYSGRWWKIIWQPKSSLCAVSQKQYCTFIINNFTNMTRVVLLLINQSLMSWTWSRLLRLILSGDLVVLCHHCRDVRDGDTALNYA